MKAELRVYSTAIVIIAPYRKLHNLTAFHELISRSADLRMDKSNYVFVFYHSQDETDYKDIIDKLMPEIDLMNLDYVEKEDVMLYYCNRQRCVNCSKGCHLTQNKEYGTGEYMTIREDRSRQNTGTHEAV